MKKVYFLVPIIGCLLFAGFYWNFLSHHAEVERAQKAAIQKAKEDKQAKEIADRKKAYEDAIALAARRKAEKEAREEKDRLEREARQAKLDEREKAYSNQEKQATQLRHLNDEIRAEKEAVAKIQDQIKSYKTEIEAQQKYVALAQDNEKNFSQILTKIAAVDKAAADAAAAAAAVAKNKS
jgi:hypothetical protein